MMSGVVGTRLLIMGGLRGKILRRWVGAVPVCPPESARKGASIVHLPHTMRVFLVWKRRCADVRAGTQAPPLRIPTPVAVPQRSKQKIWCLRSFRKWQNRKFGACGASAKVKTENLALAELPQAFRNKK